MVIDPAIDSHYGTGYERSRLFPDGRPSLEFVRSMDLLGRLLPPPPARLLDVGGGPGTYAAPLAQRGYQVHLVDPVELHVEQARQAAGSDPAAAFTPIDLPTPVSGRPRIPPPWPDRPLSWGVVS
jgi:2-polyprenyl-3-methyl-5-hydroxy-6-metoxy-1,4-benzoquinol methylase